MGVRLRSLQKLSDVAQLLVFPGGVQATTMDRGPVGRDRGPPVMVAIHRTETAPQPEKQRSKNLKIKILVRKESIMPVRSNLALIGPFSRPVRAARI